MKSKQVPKKKGKLILAVVSIIAVISVMIVSSVGASTRGVELHEFEEEIAGVEVINRKLKDEMIMNSSLTKVSQSTGDDFSIPETVVYLNKEIPVLGYAK